MSGPDYVVIGAGSAGCVVACRLVQGGARVVLLERVPAIQVGVFIYRLPAAAIERSCRELEPQDRTG